MAADVIEWYWKPKGTPFLRRESLLVFEVVMPICNCAPLSLRCKTADAICEVVRLPLSTP